MNCFTNKDMIPLMPHMRKQMEDPTVNHAETVDRMTIYSGNFRILIFVNRHKKGAQQVSQKDPCCYCTSVSYTGQSF